jgi:hypothetical protein
MLMIQETNAKPKVNPAIKPIKGIILDTICDAYEKIVTISMEKLTLNNLLSSKMKPRTWVSGG